MVWKIRVADYMSWGGLKTRRACRVFCHENGSLSLLHYLIVYEGHKFLVPELLLRMWIFMYHQQKSFHCNPDCKWDHFLFFCY